MSGIIARNEGTRSGALPRTVPSDQRELLELVYEDLRRLARSYLRRERHAHTLSATCLVHEAFERLVCQTRVAWQGRSHFFAVAAQAMRRILVDHARRQARLKRGGDWQRITLDAGSAFQPAGGGMGLEALLDLDRALVRLADLDERQSRVAELRYFAGMRMEEIATALGVSKRTVEGDWTHAKAWLRREISREREA
ncbi:MAG: ECF-type sigma factor [Myxococcota bacterium]|nr:ECF-type sigma factor [Myxococcota bacterium]